MDDKIIYVRGVSINDRGDNASVVYSIPIHWNLFYKWIYRLQIETMVYSVSILNKQIYLTTNYFIYWDLSNFFCQKLNYLHE